MTRRFPQEITDGYLKVSASNVSDACDRLSINGAVTGILPLYPCAKIVGHAATLKMAKPKDGVKESVIPATFTLIETAGAGAVLVIDSQDNPTVNTLAELPAQRSSTMALSAVLPMASCATWMNTRASACRFTAPGSRSNPFVAARLWQASTFR